MPLDPGMFPRQDALPFLIGNFQRVNPRFFTKSP